MKIHKKCLVENATHDHPTRAVITEPWLDITDGKGTLVSTDGKIMAMIPVDVESGDVAGYVSGAVLKSARKQLRNLPDSQIGLNGVATLADGSTLPRNGSAPADATFPNWRQVVPKDVQPAMVLQLDAKLLWQLAQAMGTQGVRLLVTGVDKPVTVEPFASGVYASDRVLPALDTARGVLMPIAPAKSCDPKTGLVAATE